MNLEEFIQKTMEILKKHDFHSTTSFYQDKDKYYLFSDVRAPGYASTFAHVYFSGLKKDKHIKIDYNSAYHIYTPSGKHIFKNQCYENTISSPDMFDFNDFNNWCEDQHQLALLYTVSIKEEKLNKKLKQINKDFK